MLVKDWTTETGLRAVLTRASKLGHLCGYVGISKAHPLYKVHYNDHHSCLLQHWERKKSEPVNMDKVCVVSLFFAEDIDAPNVVLYFQVHGGITYSDQSDKYPVESSDLWWFGFDTNHSQDQDNPKDKEYCIAECESLAKQLAEIRSEI